MTYISLNGQLHAILRVDRRSNLNQMDKRDFKLVINFDDSADWILRANI